jgi:uncharacterized protein YfdQ (DUF2303 family)
MSGDTRIIQSGSAELARYANELGRQQKHELLSLMPNPSHELFVVLPGENGTLIMKKVDQDNSRRPFRKAETVILKSMQSFIEYVAEHKTAFTRIFAKPSNTPPSFTAILDYHGTAGHEPDWCEHICELQICTTQQFATWKGHDNKLIAQADFAEFLKDNRLDIMDPLTSNLLELVMNLEATSERRCVSKVQTNAGMAFKFEEDVRASNGGGYLQVPQTMTVRISMFIGADPIDIECDFKLRVSDQGRVSFAYRMLGVDAIYRKAIENASIAITAATGTPVYI